MRKDIAPKAHPRTIQRARDLRARMSLPEVLLWRVLRGHPDHLKFRRQHPTGPYVLDFFCNDARLAIEIDGAAHGLGNQPARDQARDRWLAANGIETLRIPASAVLRDVDTVLDQILSVARARLPLHRPADGLPPRGELGGD